MKDNPLKLVYKENLVEIAENDPNHAEGSADLEVRIEEKRAQVVHLRLDEFAHPREEWSSGRQNREGEQHVCFYLQLLMKKMKRRKS